MKKILLFASAAVALIGCAQKELDDLKQPAAGQEVKLTINVDYPQGGATKVGFSDTGYDENTALVWKGDETMTLIFGQDNANGTDNKNNPSLSTTAENPGVFSGTVTIPSADYTIADLRALVVPHECGAYFNGFSADGSILDIPVATEQVQAKNGAPNFLYIPFFYDFTSTTITENAENDYTFSGLQLKAASDLVLFDIHGATESDEVFKDITVTCDNTQNPLSGTVQWSLGSTGVRIGNAGVNYFTVSLEEEVNVSGESVAKVFAAFMCKNDRTIVEVAVNTNKAIYKKTYPASGDAVIKLPRTEVDDFCVHKVGINLANGFTRTLTGIQYKADDGEWQSSIPQTFESLAVKTDYLAEDQLTEILAAVNAQNSASLDLSEAKYESETYPSLIGATSDSPNTALKSIKFPSNVTAIANSAFIYCTGLESVDLTGIKTIGENAFQASGLKTLNIPSSVTSMGYYSFTYLQQVTEIYYDASITSSTDDSGNGKTGKYAFCNRDQNYTNSSWNNPDLPLKITFGPNMKFVAKHIFDTQARLTELVIEGDNVLFADGEWGIRAYNLKRIEFKGAVTDLSSLGLGGDFAKNLTENEGIIIIPDGQYEAFIGDPVVNRLLNTGKYRLREKSKENDADVPTPVLEYSADGSTWSAEIPSTFSKLYARTSNAVLSADDLAAIKTATDAQSAAVELDLSGAKYESNVFPTTFSGSSTAPYTMLKSIKFPVNVVSIANSAFRYNTALESVDLTGIRTIGTYSFQWSGLKTLNVPSSVTSMGQEAFGYLKNVTDIYWNATIPTYTKGASTYKYLANRKNYDSWNSEAYPLTVTIGPDVVALPPYFFDTNARLTNLIINASNLIFFDQWVIRAYNIRRIEFTGDVPAESYLSFGGDFAKKMFDNGGTTGVIVVPDDKYDAYAANKYIKLFLDYKLSDTDANAGKYYRLVKKSEENVSAEE